MGVIGNVIVNLAASTAEFDPKIEQAGHKLDEFHKKAGEGVKGGEAGGGIGLGEIAGIGAAVEGFRMLGEGAEKFIDIGKEAVRTAVEWVAETTKMATSNFRLAGSLGMPVDKLMAYQNAAKRAAGVVAEDFNADIQKMEKNLAEAAMQGGQTAETLEHLGLSAKDLASSGADEAFEKIVEKISQIKNPSEQAIAAFQIFGKSGQQLLPMFQQGSEGIKDAIAEGQKFGTTMKDIDAAKLAGVNDNFEQLGERFDGVKNKLTLALAPSIISISQKILDLLPSADSFSSAFDKGIHMVGMGIGYLMDGWRLLKIGIFDTTAVVVENFAQTMDSLDALVQGVVSLLNKLPGVHIQIGNTLRDIASENHLIASVLADTAKDEWNKPWPHEQIDKFFDDAKKKADDLAQHINDKKPNFGGPLADSMLAAAKKIGEALKDLKKQVDEFGMTEGQKKLANIKALGGTQEQIAQAQQYVDKLKQLEVAKKGADYLKELQKSIREVGMTDGQKKLDELKQLGIDPKVIEQAKKFADQLDEAQKRQKLFEEGKHMTEEGITPLQKYNAELDKLNKMLAIGAINQDIFNAAKKKAHDEFEKSIKKNDEEKHATAVIRRFDFRVPGQTRHVDPVQESIARTNNLQLKEAQKQSGWLQDMWRFQKNSLGQLDNGTEVADF